MSTSTAGGGGSGGAPATCGDGVKEGAEQCDGPDLGGLSCADLGYSNPAGLICGVNCDLKGGGCSATCDGAKLEPGETCDGAHLGNNSCQDFGFANPAGLTCIDCQPNAAGCMAACGNNVLEVGEVCDGNNLGGKTCQTFGYVGAAGLTCAPGCAGHSTAGCAAACNGTLEPGETCDGNNLNGKTCQDFGYVATAGLTCVGCAYATNGCTKVCGNNVVEPGEQCDDGNAFGGDGCGATCQFEAGGTTCASAIGVSLPLGSKVLNHTTQGGGLHSSTKCTSAGPDRVFAVTPTANGFLTANLVRSQTTFNTVLYASNSCTDGVNPGLVCADSKDPNNAAVLKGGEVVSFRVTAGQTWYLFVDGYSNAEVGAFQLVVDLSTGNGCGDPVPIPLEPGTPMLLLGNTSGLGSGEGGGGGCGGFGIFNAWYQITRSTAGSITAFADPALTNYNSILWARTACLNQGSELGCSDVPGASGEVLSLPSVQANVPIFLGVGGNPGGLAQFGDYGLLVTP